MQTELSALRSQLWRAEKAEPAAGLNGSDSDYIAKLRNFKYYETLFELFTKQYEVARIDESREGAVIQVLDAAQPPESKSKPKKAQIVITTTLAAGVALLVFIFLRYAWRSADKTPELVRKITRLRIALKKAVGIS